MATPTKITTVKKYIEEQIAKTRDLDSESIKPKFPQKKKKKNVYDTIYYG